MIDVITNWVNYICSGAETGDGGHSTDLPLIVKTAFTGAAADNIGGNTLTKTFGLAYDGYCNLIESICLIWRNTFLFSKHTSLSDSQRDARRELFSKVNLLHCVNFAPMLHIFR